MMPRVKFFNSYYVYFREHNWKYRGYKNIHKYVSKDWQLLNEEEKKPYVTEALKSREKAREIIAKAINSTDECKYRITPTSAYGYYLKHVAQTRKSYWDLKAIAERWKQMKPQEKYIYFEAEKLNKECIDIHDEYSKFMDKRQSCHISAFSRWFKEYHASVAGTSRKHAKVLMKEAAIEWNKKSPEDKQTFKNKHDEYNFIEVKKTKIEQLLRLLGKNPGNKRHLTRTRNSKKINAYNLFIREGFKNAISNDSREHMKILAAKWRQMSPEDKVKYQKLRDKDVMLERQ